MKRPWHEHLSGNRFGCTGIEADLTFITAMGHALLRAERSGCPITIVDCKGSWIAQARVKGLTPQVRERITGYSKWAAWRRIAWRDLEDIAGVLEEAGHFFDAKAHIDRVLAETPEQRAEARLVYGRR